MSDTACPPTRSGRVKWGRIISLAGAMGLCVSFFMPHVLGMRAPIGMLVSSSSLDNLTILPPFFAAALLLPMLLFAAVLQMDAAAGARKFLSWVQCMICLLVLITSLAGFSYVVWGIWPLAGVWIILYVPLGIGCVALVLTIVALVSSRLARKAAASQFALWTYYLAFFTTIASLHDFIICAGLWLSIAACGTLAIGSAIDWFQCRRVPE